MVFLNVNFERAMIYNQNLTTNIPIVSSFPIILPLSGFLKLIFTVEFVEFRINNSFLGSSIVILFILGLKKMDGQILTVKTLGHGDQKKILSQIHSRC